MTLQYLEGEQVALPAIPVQDSMVLSAAKTAVVVVDMQNDFVTAGGSLVVPDAAATLPAIADLLARARRAGAHVAYTQDTHLPADREFAIWPQHCLQHTWGWQIVDQLAPADNDVIAQKSRYDGFYGTQLDHYLTRIWQVEHLVLVGTIASICVLHTAASAGLRWFHVVAPIDGTSALSEFDMALTMRQISWLYTGHVVRTCSAVAFA
jgi:nicotinamidase-related amidase